MPRQQKNVPAEAKNTAVVSGLTMEEMFADASAGMKNIDHEDLALPFLKIVSGLDPLLDDHEHIRKGDIVNTVTLDVWKPEKGVLVIPCAYQRKFIRWAQRGSGTGAPVAIYDTEAECPKVIRSKEDNREYVQDETGDYIERTAQWYVKVYDPDTGAITNAMIAMKSTQLKKSKKWMSMIMSRELKGPNGPFTPAMYSHIYKLTSQSEENSKGKWHGWEISLHGQVPDAGVYNSAKAFHTSVEAGDVKVAHSQDDASNKNDDINPDDVPF
jgi:hypothetical protein